MNPTDGDGNAAQASPDWSPELYLRFGDERTRAARDLLAAVPLGEASQVVDVGCGPGNSTALLKARFPRARLVGLDASASMLAEAARRLPDVRFEIADATVWTPDHDIDLVFANATYQWVLSHLEQLPRVLSAMAADGVVAVQMPDNVAQPAHAMMRETAAAGPWAARLANAARPPLASPEAYYEALKPHARRVDVWRTTYHHVLADADAIVEFISSTGLRPFLVPLSAKEREAFLADYRRRIAKAYPPLADGTVLLAFPRLFIVAVR